MAGVTKPLKIFNAVKDKKNPESFYDQVKVILDKREQIESDFEKSVEEARSSISDLNTKILPLVSRVNHSNAEILTERLTKSVTKLLDNIEEYEQNDHVSIPGILVEKTSNIGFRNVSLGPIKISSQSRALKGTAQPNKIIQTTLNVQLSSIGSEFHQLKNELIREISSSNLDNATKANSLKKLEEEFSNLHRTFVSKTSKSIKLVRDKTSIADTRSSIEKQRVTELYANTSSRGAAFKAPDLAKVNKDIKSKADDTAKKAIVSDKTLTRSQAEKFIELTKLPIEDAEVELEKFFSTQNFNLTQQREWRKKIINDRNIPQIVTPIVPSSNAPATKLPVNREVFKESKKDDFAQPSQMANNLILDQLAKNVTDYEKAAIAADKKRVKLIQRFLKDPDISLAENVPNYANYGFYGDTTTFITLKNEYINNLNAKLESINPVERNISFTTRTGEAYRIKKEIKEVEDDTAGLMQDVFGGKDTNLPLISKRAVILSQAKALGFDNVDFKYTDGTELDPDDGTKLSDYREMVFNPEKCFEANLRASYGYAKITSPLQVSTFKGESDDGEMVITIPTSILGGALYDYAKDNDLRDNGGGFDKPKVETWLHDDQKKLELENKALTDYYTKFIDKNLNPVFDISTPNDFKEGLLQSIKKSNLFRNLPSQEVFKEVTYNNTPVIFRSWNGNQIYDFKNSNNSGQEFDDNNSNIGTLVKLAKEIVARDLAEEVVQTQLGMLNQAKAQGRNITMSDVNPVELNQNFYRRLNDPNFISTFEEKAYNKIRDKLENYVENLRTNASANPGYFVSLLNLDNDIRDVVYRYVAHHAQTLYINNSGNKSTFTDMILPRSAAGVEFFLEDNPNVINGQKILKHIIKEKRLINFPDNTGKVNINNLPVVEKQFTASEDVEYRVALFNNSPLGGMRANIKGTGKLFDPRSVELSGIDKARLQYVNDRDKGINEQIQKAIADRSLAQREEINNYFKSWNLFSPESAAIYTGDLIRRRRQVMGFGLDIFEPEKMIDALTFQAREKGGVGFDKGRQIRDNIVSYAALNPSSWGFFDFWGPMKSADEIDNLTKSIKSGKYSGPNAFKSHVSILYSMIDSIPIIGAQKQGGVLGKFWKEGAIPFYNPVVAKPLTGPLNFKTYAERVAEAQKKYKFTLVYDIDGKSAVGVPQRYANKLLLMTGAIGLDENGNKYSAIGKIFQNGKVKFIDNVGNSSIGKFLRLDKRDIFKKKNRGEAYGRSIFNLGVDLIGYSIRGLVENGAIVIDRVLDTTAPYRAFKNSAIVQNTTENINALKTVAPLIRPIFAAIVNGGIVFTPLYYFGILSGPGAALIAVPYGVSKAASILSSAEYQVMMKKNILNFMGMSLEDVGITGNKLDQIVVDLYKGENNVLRRYTNSQLMEGQSKTLQMFKEGGKFNRELIAGEKYIISNGFFSPHGWFGRRLAGMYDFFDGQTKLSSMFSKNNWASQRLSKVIEPFENSGSAADALGRIAGTVSRGTIFGGALYLLGFNPAVYLSAGIGSVLLETSARAMVPSITAKLAFLGESSAFRGVANAWGKIHTIAVEFPVLDSIGIVQTSNWFNQQIALPAYQVFKGNLDPAKFLWGGNTTISLKGMSFADANIFGVSREQYNQAMNAPLNSEVYATIHYDGLFSMVGLAGLALNLGLGYVPAVIGFENALFQMTKKLGFAERTFLGYDKWETFAPNSILGRMTNAKSSVVRFLGKSLDSGFGLKYVLNTDLGLGVTIGRAGSFGIGAVGGFLLGQALGWGTAGSIALGLGAGVSSAIFLPKIVGGLYNGVLTGWARIPLSASSFATGFGGIFGGVVGQGVVTAMGITGVIPTLAVNIAASLAGALLIPLLVTPLGWVGAVLAAGFGTAGVSWVAAKFGLWLEGWWKKTAGVALDSLKSISPLLAAARVLKAIEEADLGRFLVSLLQFAMSFSTGMTAVGVVVVMLPPQVAIAPTGAVAGGLIPPIYNEFIIKSTIGLSEDNKDDSVMYNLTINLAKFKDLAKDKTVSLEIYDTPITAKNISVIKSENCPNPEKYFTVGPSRIILNKKEFNSSEFEEKICIDYKVKFVKKLSDVKSTCNKLFAKAKISGDDKEYEGNAYKCVDKDGQYLGDFGFNSSSLEFYDPDSSEGVDPGKFGQVNCSVKEGDYAFPVDPSQFVGFQCSWQVVQDPNATHGPNHLPSLDLSGPRGSPVYSILDGDVYFVESGLTEANNNNYDPKTGLAKPGVYGGKGNYGNQVYIKHPTKGIQTAYAHFDQVLVKVGDHVKAGQQIGTIGMTGFTTGPHLHFDTRDINDWTKSVEPCDIINCKKYLRSAYTSANWGKCFAKDAAEQGAPPVSSCTSPDEGGADTRNSNQLAKDLSSTLESCPTSGEITLPGFTQKLLPLASSHRCMTPKGIVIHWSGGWSNAYRTADVLVSRNLSCQIAMDSTNNLQLLKFYDDKIQMAWCTGTDANTGTINFELSGSDFDSVFDNSNNENYESLNETTSHAVDTVCYLINKYNIPINNIVGHFQLLPGDKPDPGPKYLAYFKSLVRNQCGN